MADDAGAAAAPPPPAVDPSAGISDAALSARLHAVLQAADLSATTERAIRKSLEEELGVSLAERKAFIRSQVCCLRSRLPAAPGLRC